MGMEFGDHERFDLVKGYKVDGGCGNRLKRKGICKIPA
jgi:hypothetical protein